MVDGGLEFGIVGCMVGASFAVLVAEEMFASGCKFLVSMTSSGRIVNRGNPLAEAGQLKLEPKALALADVISQVGQGLEVQAHAKEITPMFDVTATWLQNLSKSQQSNNFYPYLRKTK